MPGCGGGGGGGGRFFVWSGTSHPFSTNRGPIGYIHRIIELAGWVRGFAVTSILMTKK